MLHWSCMHNNYSLGLLCLIKREESQLGMQKHMCGLESCSYMWSQIDTRGKTYRNTEKGAI